MELKTYGDLKKAITTIARQQKGEKIVSQGKSFALDQVLGLIPGASNAKTMFDFVKTIVKKPDTKKTTTWLDKLDIDDKVSSIVDDTVENGFMQSMAKSIEGEDDAKALEPDFNMNIKLQDYLKANYNNRTVSMMEQYNKQVAIKNKQKRIRKAIREHVKRLLQEADPPRLDPQGNPLPPKPPTGGGTPAPKMPPPPPGWKGPQNAVPTAEDLEDMKVLSTEITKVTKLFFNIYNQLKGYTNSNKNPSPYLDAYGRILIGMTTPLQTLANPGMLAGAMTRGFLKIEIDLKKSVNAPSKTPPPLPPKPPTIQMPPPPPPKKGPPPPPPIPKR